MNSAEVILRSAALRGKGQFRQAIDLVKEALHTCEPEELLNAYREMLSAAMEAGLEDEASEYATALRRIDPELPSAKHYLAGRNGL
jgi:tetratricopeptide (TPR) repeat protein